MKKTTLVSCIFLLTYSFSVIGQSTPQLQIITDGLARPWSMDFFNENEVLVAEKEGSLLRVNLETKSKAVITGFPNDLFKSFDYDSSQHRLYTYPGSLPNGTKNLTYNGGIFQVLLDPNFKTNSFIYVSYVSEKEKNKLYATKVIRAKLAGNSLTEIKEIFIATPYSDGLFHFGGGMVFGADGKLYLTMGERLFTEGHEPEVPIAQDLTDKRGKIYRINSDGSIPEDNPDFGKNAPEGLYAVGIRAAQGLALNKETGQIWFSEHGTNQGDELNVLKARANYGWPIKTSGTYRSPTFTPPKMENTVFTDPVLYWKQTVAPTGLTFYSGHEFPEWQGNLIVPGLSGGSLWRVVLDGETVKSMEQLFIDQPIRLRKAIQSPEGKLYLLTDDPNGRIIQVKNN